MVVLWNRADHYIFILWFLSIYLLFFPRLISVAAYWMSTILWYMVWPKCEFRMQVWNVLRAARWKCRTQKIAKNWACGQHRTNLSGYIFATKAYIDNRKNLLSSNTSPTSLHNMVNFGPLTAEIDWRVWGTPSYFNGYHILATLLHGTLLVGVSQTLQHWTEGATYIRQGDHHVGHWPTILVGIILHYSLFLYVCFCCVTVLCQEIG